MHTNILLSLSCGATLGLIYGLFFVFTQRRVFFSNTDASLKNRIFFSTLTAVRFFVFALILYYLLHWEQINYILLIVSYLGAFWATITSKKAFGYDRDRRS